METPDEIMARVGRRIGDLRKEAGLTQAAAAEALDMTLSNYQRVEYGLQNLTIKTMARIAALMDVPIARLFETTAIRKRRRGRPKST